MNNMDTCHQSWKPLFDTLNIDIDNLYSESQVVYPKKEELILPKYVSLINFREKNHLIFEKRVDDNRLNLKMVLPEEYDLQEQLELFKEKINIKYKNIIDF